MKSSVDPPNGYGYGAKEDSLKFHIVRLEPFNNVTICGDVIRTSTVVDVGYPDRDVCSKCIKIRKQNGL